MELPKPTPPSSKRRLILNPCAGALPTEAILPLDPFLEFVELLSHLIADQQPLSLETQKRRSGLAGEDTATIMLRHENDAVSVVDCSFSPHHIQDAFPETMIEVEGNLDCIRLSESGVIDVTSREISWRENASSPLLEWSERPLHVI